MTNTSSPRRSARTAASVEQREELAALLRAVAPSAPGWVAVTKADLNHRWLTRDLSALDIESYWLIPLREIAVRIVATRNAAANGGPSPFVRDNEVLLFVVNADAGICAGKNKTCRKQLVSAMFCWDHRITDGRQWPHVIGEDRFSCNRHADGTICFH